MLVMVSALLEISVDKLMIFLLQENLFLRMQFVKFILNRQKDLVVTTFTYVCLLLVGKAKANNVIKVSPDTPLDWSVCQRN